MRNKVLPSLCLVHSELPKHSTEEKAEGEEYAGRRERAVLALKGESSWSGELRQVGAVGFLSCLSHDIPTAPSTAGDGGRHWNRRS